jgi:hypothetical protein
MQGVCWFRVQGVVLRGDQASEVGNKHDRREVLHVRHLVRVRVRVRVGVRVRVRDRVRVRVRVQGLHVL